ncbi:MAG: tetratricopeptide repeat protein [Chitinophagales bacterium]
MAKRKQQTIKNKKQNKVIPTWQEPKTLFLLLGILLLTFVAFWPSLQNGFTNWDDTYYVTQNTLIKSLSFEHLKGIFTTSERSLYHPFTMLSFALNYQMDELNPFTYHFTNLLFHLLNTFLAFYFAYLISGKQTTIGLITAVLFGIHPMHVESVAWVSERKDVLFTFFFLAAASAYWHYTNSRKSRTYILALLFFIAALFSKATAVTLPLVLLLLDYFKGRKWNVQAIVEKIPFFILSVIFGLLTIKYQSQGAIGALEEYSFLERMMFASYGFVMYIIKFLLPFNLSAFYPYPATENMPFFFKIAPLFAISIVALAIFSLKKTKIIAFGLAFYAMTVFLTLQFVSVGGAVMADRYTYVPYIGLSFIVAYYLNELFSTKQKRNENLKNIAFVTLAITVFAFSYITFERCKIWKNSETLWSDVIEKNENVPYAHYNRGIFRHYETKKYDGAMNDYSKAIQLKKDYGDAYYNRGALYYYQKKDSENALKDYTKAVELMPKKAEILHTRGMLYHYTLEKYDLALADYNRVMELDNGLDKAYNNRGTLYFNKKKEYDLALKDFNVAIRLNDKDGQYFMNRSYANYFKGNKDAALKDASQAKKLGFAVQDSYVEKVKALEIEK